MNLHLDDKKIWELYNKGFTQEKISKIMGCSKKTIGNHINKMKNNLKIYNNPFCEVENKKNNPKKKNIPFERIEELYNKGLTDQ